MVFDCRLEHSELQSNSSNLLMNLGARVGHLALQIVCVGQLTLQRIKFVTNKNNAATEMDVLVIKAYFKVFSSVFIECHSKLISFLFS